MSIQSQRELDGLRVIGRIVRQVLEGTAAAVRPGVTTGELDARAAQLLAVWGAVSAPARVYGFPGSLCISVNDEAIHGVPSRRILREGDLVKLDLVAEKDGFYADAAVTVEVGMATERARALRRCAERAFHQGLRFARPGYRAYDIGKAVEKEVVRSGFAVVRGLCGHGVGRTIHEEPCIPNRFDRSCAGLLTEGLVITIEPIIAAGRGQGELLSDGWTIRTKDHSLSAHYEHTVVITSGEPMLLTA